MALIKCPECGTEVSDSAVSCPKCGFPVEKWVREQKDKLAMEEAAAEEAKKYVEKVKKDKELEEERVRQAEEQKRRMKALMPKIIAVVIVCIVIGISIPLVNNLIIIPGKNYEKAVSLMEEGKYKDTIEIFQNLDENYKDTKEKLDFALKEQDRIDNEYQTNQALMYLHNGNCDMANDIISQLRDKGYKVPEDIETEINNETTYQEALKKGKHSLSNAVELLKTLPSDYKNCAEIIEMAEELLPHEGRYLVSADFGDSDYYGDEGGRFYDADFKVVFCLDDEGKGFAKITDSHSVTHDEKQGYEFEQYNFPIAEGKYQLFNRGGYCFTLENITWHRTRDGDYNVSWLGDEIMLFNTNINYLGKKIE